MCKAVGSLKFCPSCKRTKELSAFGVARRTPDGLATYCKECRNAKAKDIRQTPEYREYYRAFEKRTHIQAYRLEQHRRLYSTQKRRAYRDRHPDRTRARDVVRWNVESGQLPRPESLPCGTVLLNGYITEQVGACPNMATEYHHHLGYEIAHHLDVQALCKSCHGLTFRKYPD